VRHSLDVIVGLGARVAAGLWSAASPNVGDEDFVGVIGDLVEHTVATDA
jgi:hypothetical protein